MNLLSRRSFLAGCAAFAAPRALAQQQAPAQMPPMSGAGGEVDVIIVGAGAAGIAAARRLSAAGRSFMLLEATGRIGGRCITDTRLFGMPFDRGAHWIRSPDLNPLTKLAPPNGLDVYQAPYGQRVRIGRRPARESELEDFLAALVRANRAINEAGRGRTDNAARHALPADLGSWSATVAFALGPYAYARDLDAMSAQDYATATERNAGAFCRQGYGALLARLADGIPVELETPVSRIDARSRTLVGAVTPRGTLSARYVIVTASTEVLARERIAFDGGLPKRHRDALSRLKLGSFDHIALDLPGNPLGLRHDDVVFERAESTHTAALLANVSGSSLTLVEVGGGFGRELAAQGEPAMVGFAVDWLTDLFGTGLKRQVRRAAATQWNEEPWALGAFATASPGGHGARRVLMEPIAERVYLAGEALHETMWGTVGGAWESGERAADAVIGRLAGAAAGPAAPAAPEPEMPPPEPAPEDNAAAPEPRRGRRSRTSRSKPARPKSARPKAATRSKPVRSKPPRRPRAR